MLHPPSGALQLARVSLLSVGGGVQGTRGPEEGEYLGQAGYDQTRRAVTSGSAHISCGASIASLCERRKRGDCDTQEDVQTRVVTTTTTAEAHTGTQSCHYLGLAPEPPPFSGPRIHLSLTLSCPSPTLHIPTCLPAHPPAIHPPPSHLSIC